MHCDTGSESSWMTSPIALAIMLFYTQQRSLQPCYCSVAVCANRKTLTCLDFKGFHVCTTLHCPLCLQVSTLRQDVDTDRALLFPDCPSAMVGAQLFKERKEAWIRFCWQCAPVTDFSRFGDEDSLFQIGGLRGLQNSNSLGFWRTQSYDLWWGMAFRQIERWKRDN